MQRLFLIIAACLALAVTGCGSDSDTTETFSSKPREEREAREQREDEKERAEEQAAAEKAAKQQAAELPEVAVPGGPPPKQLVTEDLKQGSGKSAQAGDQVQVNYVGVLYSNGEIFDASWGKGAEPFSFTLGAQEVIPGWDEGLQGMKVGGERKLTIPPDLAYGEQGSYPSIPPNATLVFQVKLLGVQ
ncbi:MAG TPA: FKBP-type peptidyl-prolyl cis-trans isomerase [Solirubrobacterales bacterium]|nr:FKBP-type peptidyl-prolyl cis-trans isomerase [Solirubrobacterales bacterium]